MAAATLFGPVVAGALIERYDWGVMTAAMGVFASSGAIPAVSPPSNTCGGRDGALTSAQLLFTGGWIFAKDP